MKMNTLRGFTIIELMITILMMGVLLSVAVPSFSSIMKQNRLSSQTNTILSALNYARAQTVNLNQNISVQPLSGSTDWAAGFRVSTGATDLQFYEGVDVAALALNHPGGATTITYLADGTISSSGSITLTITPNECHTGDPDLRVITINLSGQATSAPGNCT